MPTKKSHITITDQFCGAGGSSQGVRRYSERSNGGVEVKLALNHWKLAIETHASNFPDTDHDCTDISACDPRRYNSTDILITSPECTNHSLAKGKRQVKAQLDMYDQGALDPAAERSRATMWDVPRFAEYHNYNIIIVENVVDARKWVMFEAWIHAMDLLDYNHKSVYLNSMFCHPTPQSRDRMYVVFWKKGNKAPNLEFTPESYCVKCEKDVSAVQSWKNPAVRWGVYGKRGQYLYCCPKCSSVVDPYYYAAFNCIDWSDFGTRIGDRKKELRPNTIKRIKYGLDKYGKEPFVVCNYSPGYSKDTTQPVGTVTGNDHHAICRPFIINDQQSTGINFRVKDLQSVTPTLSTGNGFKLVTPFIIKGEHTLQTGYTKRITEPFQTQTVRQSMSVVTPPMVIELNSTGKAKPVTSPASTLTAGGINQGILSSESWKSFIGYYYKQHQVSQPSDALGTCNTHDRHFLINYEQPTIDDCYYRMLKAHELKLAMAFDKEYVVLGSSKNQVKQLGNAVTPPAMEWLIGRAVESLS